VKKLTRREFIYLSATAAAGSALVACAPKTIVVEKQIEVTKLVETEKVVKETVVVEKEKEVTKVVEKEVEKVVTATPLPPSQFAQAPELAGLAQSGQLPPVEERLPAEPLVVVPTNMVGTYGGTLYGGSTSPDATNDLQACMNTGCFSFSNDLSEIYPNVAESYEFSDDSTQCTIYLRKGIKWSDGQPFGADDMLFFFDDWMLHEGLSPSVSNNWKAGGEPLTATKIDDFTVQFDFAAPKPTFGVVHFSFAPEKPWRARHFMEQFHIDYNPDADAEAKALGFDNWQAQFGKVADVNYGVMDPRLPVLDPWMTVRADSEGDAYDRNPYYFKVDTEGNQLPYIDGVDVKYSTSLEMTNMRAVAGELSALARDLLLFNYPLFQENAEKGDYHVLLGSSARTVDGTVVFNQEHPDPVLKEIFRDKRFRQAASVAIDRDEINDLVFLGQGRPLQAVCHPSCSYYKEEWGSHFAQYDPDLANQLLDEMGLEMGSDGVRLRPDGKPLTFLLEFVQHHGPQKQQAELVVKHLAAVGIKAEGKEGEKSYIGQRNAAQEQDATMWMVDRTLERAEWVRGGSGAKLAPGGDSTGQYCRAWQNYRNTDGQSGIEPPQEAWDLWDAYTAWEETPFGSQEYMAAAEKVHDLIADNLWVIGLIGEVPWPILVKNNLENVFTGEEEHIWIGASNWYLLPQRAEQWFWKA
jgi:peptide/nickel transport system substrate-binding protein